MLRQRGGDSVSDRKLAIVWIGGGTKPSGPAAAEVEAAVPMRGLFTAKGEEESESAEAERPLVCITSGGGRSPEERIRMRYGRSAWAAIKKAPSAPRAKGQVPSAVSEPPRSLAETD